MSTNNTKARYELERITYRNRLFAEGHGAWLLDECRKRRFKEQRCDERHIGQPPEEDTP